MDRKTIENFLLANAGCFEEGDVARIAQGLEMVPDSAAIEILGSEFKKPTFAQVFSVIGGHIGLDRFYLGQTTLGVIKLVTCGGFGIWTLVDLFIIMNAARSCNADRIVWLINTYAEKRRPTANTTQPNTTQQDYTRPTDVEVSPNDFQPEEMIQNRLPGEENPMDYAPKDDYSAYAPKE